jgi:hypothetical protein
MQREHNYNVPYTSTAALASQILKLTTKQPRSLFNPNLRSNGGKEAMVTAEFFFTSGRDLRKRGYIQVYLLCFVIVQTYNSKMVL